MEAVERIEVAIRSSWAHKMSEEFGSHPHLNRNPFENFTEYLQSLNLLIQDLDRTKHLSSEVTHYFSSYTELPIPPI